MKSFVSPEFRKCLNRMPPQVQEQARRAYERWKEDPKHPGLGFRQLKPHDAYSVRIGLHYRAIGAEVSPGVFVWDWIGSHSDYDKLVDSLG